MSEVTEMLERAEHAAHGGGHGDGHGHGDSGGANISKLVGLTMAIMGVLLAFCAALVGGERTELVKTMVEQTQANSEEQAQSTKFRMLFSQLEQLRAIAPTNDQVAALHHDLDALQARTPPALAEAVEGSRRVGVGISEMIQPTPQPLARLIGLVRKARHETGLAHHWTESYNPAVHAHFEAAEGFERAQLCAEIGIVLASIALLLAARKAWYGAIALGVVCAALVGITYSKLKGELHEAEERIEHAQHAYNAVADSPDDARDDEDTLHTLEDGMSPENLRIAHPAGTEEAVGSGEHGGAEHGGAEHGGAEHGAEHGGAEHAAEPAHH